jgi:hypothetical protein
MTIPSTTPGRLGRVRASRMSLFAALLATAAIALTGALAVAGAQAAQPPQPRTYKVTANVDGRETPNKATVRVSDFLLKGERVEVECQRYGGLAYGSRLWDLVTRGAST